MNIAVVADYNNILVPMRMKYLHESGHKIYFFRMFNNDKLTREMPSWIHSLIIKSDKTGKISKHIDKAKQIRKLTKELKIDILHVINMGFAHYAIFSSAKKMILENNGSDVLVEPKNDWRLKPIYQICYKLAGGVVQDSFVGQNAGVKLGASKNNNEVIEVGIDFNLFNEDIKNGIARKKLGLDSNIKIVFSPRSITALYNIDIILQSISIVKKEYPDVKFIFAAPHGDWDEKYKKIIDDNNLKENIIITGYLDKEKELKYFYKDADVVISVPSSDSCPNTVSEALACGKDVIISELPWYNRKYEKDVHLFTVPVRDHYLLAQQIVNVLSGNKSIDKQLSVLRAKENSCYISNGKKLEALYKKVLKI